MELNILLYTDDYRGDHSADVAIAVKALPGETGKSIRFGEWINRGDGYWALRFQKPSAPSATRFGPWTFEKLRTRIVVRDAKGALLFIIEGGAKAEAIRQLEAVFAATDRETNG